jgi:hypothetical protein
MGFWERLRRAVRREASDVQESVDDALGRANAALDRRERELTGSPEERLRLQEQRVSESDANFDEVRRRIDGKDA